MAGCSRGEDGGGARRAGRRHAWFVGFCAARASLERVGFLYVFALCFL